MAAYPLAFKVLPERMDSKDAWRMLTAVALQEGRFSTRMQHEGGPARGWFQFERIGVEEVARHRASAPVLRQALDQLGLGQVATRLRQSGKQRTTGVTQLYNGLAFSESVAVVVARLALWRHPDALPGPNDSAIAWQQYRHIWRPGKPHHETWGSCWAHACGLVNELF